MDWITQYSVVQHIGLSSRPSHKSCGYCKVPTDTTSEEGSQEDSSSSSSSPNPDEKQSICYGIWGFRMSAEEYAYLCDCGWRRSGRYLYKPIMESTCCPMYTIRLDAVEFKLSRSQKKVLKLWQDFLKDDKRPISTEKCKNQEEPKSYAGPRQVGQPTPPRQTPRPNAGKKRKQMRRERAEKRMREKGIDVDEYKKQKQEKEKARCRKLEDFLDNSGTDYAHRLEIRIVQAGSDLFTSSMSESFEVYMKYQKLIHNDKECNLKGFKSFLVDNPIVRRSVSSLSEMGIGEGAYHQQYLIDGKIVAVGIIDILPQCVSSAYFYYDPDYKFLNFGTYSALREIALVRRLYQLHRRYRYYYMGYYVHSCRKMRYKAAFRPSELLCDRSHQWVPLPECLEMIERNDGKFTVFRPDAEPAPVGDVMSCRPLQYDTPPDSSLVRIDVDEELAERLTLFAKYIGPKCDRFYVIT